MMDRSARRRAVTTEAVGLLRWAAQDKSPPATNASTAT